MGSSDGQVWLVKWSNGCNLRKPTLETISATYRCESGFQKRSLRRSWKKTGWAGETRQLQPHRRASTQWAPGIGDREHSRWQMAYPDEGVSEARLQKRRSPPSSLLLLLFHFAMCSLQPPAATQKAISW